MHSNNRNTVVGDNQTPDTPCYGQPQKDGQPPKDEQPPKNTYLAWLTLACCQFNPSQQQRLLQQIPHALELFSNRVALKAAPAILRRAGFDKRSKTNPQSLETRLERAAKLVEASLRWEEADGNFLIPFDAPGYPQALREIPDPPPLLFVTGDLQVLKLAQLAVVGSRKTTPAALAIAERLSGQLATCGLSITSGLARGTDQAAHNGCLDAGGKTIAVMATGPDRCYPSEHLALLDRITENGALVTEFPPGTAPIPRNFPQRNRIISGLSLGTLVIEARIRSGTLVTARHALEQNREVFALPGSVLNPQTQGCHLLIQQGAKLVQEVNDIVEELSFERPENPTHSIRAGDSGAASNSSPAKDDQNGQDDMLPAGGQSAAMLGKILDAAGYDPVTIDTLAHATGFAVNEIMSLVLVLELQSKLKSLGDGRFVRC